jgi:hypothetical protein
VVGMQFAISDPAAITFAAELYSGLAQGFPVDVAVTEGRRALATETDLEWATPVLFMRVPDGRLFDIDVSGLTPASPPRPPAAVTDRVAEPDRPANAVAPARRRAVRWGGLAAAIGAVAVAAALLVRDDGGGPIDFRARLAGALKPLVTANRELTGAVLSLDAEASPRDALARYYSAADANTAFDAALRRIPPPASRDAHFKGESRRLSNYQSTYLRYVIAFLTGHQTRRHEDKLGSVSARLVRTLGQLEGLAPGAHDSVGGAEQLKKWATRDAGGTGVDASPDSRAGAGSRARWLLDAARAGALRRQRVEERGAWRAGRNRRHRRGRAGAEAAGQVRPRHGHRDGRRHQRHLHGVLAGRPDTVHGFRDQPARSDDHRSDDHGRADRPPHDDWPEHRARAASPRGPPTSSISAHHASIVAADGMSATSSTEVAAINGDGEELGGATTSVTAADPGGAHRAPRPSGGRDATELQRSKRQWLHDGQDRLGAG